MIRHGLCAALLALVPLGAAADRVLSIGGAVTEIIFALDQQDRLVGRDLTSTFPDAARALPDIGYMRALSPEGVLSVNPDLIVMDAGSGPPETLETLAGAGITMVTVPDAATPEEVLERVGVIAGALGVPEAGTALRTRLRAEFNEALHRVAAQPGPPPRVLFILSNQGGRLTGAGQATEAEAMIALAGGVNALHGFDGYKPLSDEAIAAAAPDVLLIMNRGAGGHGGAAENTDAAYLSHPALARTPAGQAGRLVRMPGVFLLGFGPRTPQAIAALHEALFPAGP